jgi:cellulose biosynthesis protein BcsQ
MTATVVAVVHCKGGICKATDTYSLAGVVAGFDKRVLVVDADPQCSLGNALKSENKAGDELSRLIFKGSAEGWASKTNHSNISHCT